MITQKSLGAALRNTQDERVSGVHPIKMQLGEPNAVGKKRHAVNDRSALQELLFKLEVVEMFQGTRMHHDRL
jgi:hypothetical protein